MQARVSHALTMPLRFSRAIRSRQYCPLVEASEGTEDTNKENHRGTEYTKVHREEVFGSIGTTKGANNPKTIFLMLLAVETIPKNISPLCSSVFFVTLWFSFSAPSL